jgi:hypothetical protein
MVSRRSLLTRSIPAVAGAAAAFSTIPSLFGEQESTISSSPTTLIPSSLITSLQPSLAVVANAIKGNKLTAEHWHNLSGASSIALPLLTSEGYTAKMQKVMTPSAIASAQPTQSFKLSLLPHVKNLGVN